MKSQESIKADAEKVLNETSNQIKLMNGTLKKEVEFYRDIIHKCVEVLEILWIKTEELKKHNDLVNIYKKNHEMMLIAMVALKKRFI